jgi:hypothetical protein
LWFEFGMSLYNKQASHTTQGAQHKGLSKELPAGKECIKQSKQQIS